jgi:hypothetical protein
VGGSLVLLGDGLRRASERRRLQAETLAQAAVEVAVNFSLASGSLRDSRENRVPKSDLGPLRESRHEVVTRYFSTPGATIMSEQVQEVITRWRQLYDNYDEDEAWQNSWSSALEALSTLEAHIRAVRSGWRQPRIAMPKSGSAELGPILLLAQRKRSHWPPEFYDTHV